MSLIFGGKLLQDPRETRRTLPPTDFDWNTGNKTTGAKTIKKRQLSLTSHIDASVNFNQTAPSKLMAQTIQKERFAVTLKQLPVFSLPPLQHPIQSAKRSLNDPPDFSRVAIQQRFKELSSAESGALRRYLQLTSKDWTVMRNYFSMGELFITAEESRPTVFSIAYSIVYNRTMEQSSVAESAGSPIILTTTEELQPLYSRSLSALQFNKARTTAPPLKTQRKAAARRPKQQRMPTAQSDLQAQLLTSLQNMQHHSTQLKQGLLELPRLVEMKQSKAMQYIQALGVQKLGKCLERLVFAQKRLGFKAWCMAAEVDKQTRQMGAVSSFMRYRVLSVTWNKVVGKLLKRVLRTWLRTVHWELIRERHELEAASALLIQKTFRGFYTRSVLIKQREKQQLERIYEALVRIQAFFRGRLARMKYLVMCRTHLEDFSIRLIQRVFRGYIGRCIAFQRRLEEAMRQAATMFQAAFRGYLIRRDILKMKRAMKERDAAIAIQAVVRGFLGRQRVRNILNGKKRDIAIRLLQRVIRGWLSRANMHKKLAEINQYRRRRNQCALKIQKVYRGFRSRVIARIMRREAQRLKAIRDPAATKINCAARRYLAKKVRVIKEKARYSRWIADAKSVREYWSDEYNAWYYYSEDTGETLWEPPKTGYTKDNTQLVLANGAVIDDPTVYVEEDATGMPVKPIDTKLCSECQERIAIRNCIQCGDKFCCPCYKDQHASGSRLKHVRPLT